MNKWIFTIGLFLCAHISMATTYYVSTSGLDSNSGTSINQAFLTLDKAVQKTIAGDSIVMRGGTYKHSVTINLATKGTQAKPCYLLAYPGERPILNFSGTAFGKRGINLTGNYWIIRGLHVVLAGDNGMIISGGAYNIIDNCAFSENKDTGLQLGGGAHDNQIINCDSYFNADPTDYGDADGFACKMDVGTNNYFYGCRAWLNVDDGWDGYLRGANNVTTILENCWTWRNGYFKDGTDAGASANGNGFKMGGSDDKTLQHNFIVKNCLAFDNKAKGFDQNNNKGSMTIYNGTAFRNGAADFSIPLSLASGKTAIVKNCLLAKGTISLGSFVEQASNSWDKAFIVNANDFISLDTTGVSGPRKADGSLPDITFAHLALGSDLIDSGIDLGISYQGSKPDLGCFETYGTNSSSIYNTKLNSNFEIKLLKGDDSQYRVSFKLEHATEFNCELWSMNGTKIWNQHQSATGSNIEIIPIDAKQLPSGVYLFRLNAGNKTETVQLRIN